MAGKSILRNLLAALAAVALVYLFLVSVGLVGAAMKSFGGEQAKAILHDFTTNPFVGLFVGILATSLVQSSSATTSTVIGLVGGGSLHVLNAIPIIMGANIGTSVTNTLVSLGHIGRRAEFRRAFAASTVHDFFNLLTVAILFPVQYVTARYWLVEKGGVLGYCAHGLSGLFGVSATGKIESPLKQVIKDGVHVATWLVDRVSDHPGVELTLCLALAGLLLFFSLKYLSRLLRGMVMQRASGFFERTLFRNAYTAFVVGIGLTIAVQSSSITTSVAVPLAGAGLLTLRQIYPYTLGANIGTTITGVLAALAATQNFEAGLTVAFAHVLFNVFGIALIAPWPPLRWLPCRLAEWLSGLAVQKRWLAFVYILTVFFLLPLVLILLTR